MFCSQPFNRVEIYSDGNVTPCCTVFTNDYYFGNIYEQSFDEIWNGEKAQKFRESILNGNLCLCDDVCPKKYSNEENTNNYNSKIVNHYPHEIAISTDVTCNVRCRFCRDNMMVTENQDFEPEINKYWLPVFKDAKSVTLGLCGEPFASKKEKLLLEKLGKKYPNIKYTINTNGILGTKDLLEKCNVYDKIETLSVSLHAATKEIYDKVVIGGNFDKVLKNLSLYSDMKRQGIIQNFLLVFVIYLENYKDIHDFVDLAKEYNANAIFWGYRKTMITEIYKNSDKYDIVNKNHPLHQELVEILKSDKMKQKHVNMFPEIQALIK